MITHTTAFAEHVCMEQEKSLQQAAPAPACVFPSSSPRMVYVAGLHWQLPKPWRGVLVLWVVMELPLSVTVMGMGTRRKGRATPVGLHRPWQRLRASGWPRSG